MSTISNVSSNHYTESSHKFSAQNTASLNNARTVSSQSEQGSKTDSAHFSSEALELVKSAEIEKKSTSRKMPQPLAILSTNNKGGETQEERMEMISDFRASLVEARKKLDAPTESQSTEPEVRYTTFSSSQTAEQTSNQINKQLSSENDAGFAKTSSVLSNSDMDTEYKATSSPVTESAQESSETKNIVASKTFSSGVSVAIHTEAFKENEENSNFGAYNQKILATITQTDGSSTTLEITNDTVFSEDENGNLIMAEHDLTVKDVDNYQDAHESGLFEEQKTDVIKGTDGDDFIVSLFQAGHIQAGEGNDTVVAFNYGGNLTLGDGDNTLIGVGENASFRVDAGNGNNTIKDIYISGTFGDGNNTINTNEMENVVLGNGDNTISAKDINNIVLGDGNNTINTGAVSRVVLGNGNNTVKAGEITDTVLGNGENVIDGKIINSLMVGNGDNNLTSERAKEVYMGNGNNAVQSDDVGLILFGNGNNTIDVGYVDIGVIVGNGNNNISAESTDIDRARGGFISSGDGNNTITMENLDNFSVAVGDGNNTIVANSRTGTGGAVLKLGDGDNSMTLKEYRGNGGGILLVRPGTGNTDLNVDVKEGYLYMNYYSKGNANILINGDVGGGSILFAGKNQDDKLVINGNVSNTRINTGSGDDNIAIDGTINGSSINTGDGNDNLVITGSILDSFIYQGLGDDSLTIGGSIIDSNLSGYNNNILKELNSLIENSILDGLPVNMDEEQMMEFLKKKLEQYKYQKA